MFVKVSKFYVSPNPLIENSENIRSDFQRIFAEPFHAGWDICSDIGFITRAEKGKDWEEEISNSNLFIGRGILIPSQELAYFNECKQVGLAWLHRLVFSDVNRWEGWSSWRKTSYAQGFYVYKATACIHNNQLIQFFIWTRSDILMLGAMLELNGVWEKWRHKYEP